MWRDEQLERYSVNELWLVLPLMMVAIITLLAWATAIHQWHSKVQEVVDAAEERGVASMAVGGHVRPGIGPRGLFMCSLVITVDELVLLVGTKKEVYPGEDVRAIKTSGSFPNEGIVIEHGQNATREFHSPDLNVLCNALERFDWHVER